MCTAVQRGNDFLAMLSHGSPVSEPRSRARDFITVPDEMCLERAVSIAPQSGQAVVLKPGDYCLEAPLVVCGKLNMRAEGGIARIHGTCVFCGSGAGGHVKGVAFCSQGGVYICVYV